MGRAAPAASHASAVLAAALPSRSTLARARFHAMLIQRGHSGGFRLPVSILPQPDETTCGATCLHSLYRYWEAEEPLDALVTRMHRVRDLVDVIGSVPSERLSAYAFSQLPALKARTRALLTANLDLARKFIAAHPQLSVAEKPRATVTFPRLAGVRDTTAFVEDAAAARGVAVAPGHYFDAPEHFRISLAGRTDRLAEGLDRLSRALKSY